MKLNWTEFLESYSRYPSVLLLLLATNTETNPATASSKTTPPPSTLRKSAAEKVSTASTSAHHNVRRFFFFFLWFPCSYGLSTGMQILCWCTLERLLRKKNNNKKTAIIPINFQLLNHTHPKKPRLLVRRNNYHQGAWQRGSQKHAHFSVEGYKCMSVRLEQMLVYSQSCE